MLLSSFWSELWCVMYWLYLEEECLYLLKSYIHLEYHSVGYIELYWKMSVIMTIEFGHYQHFWLEIRSLWVRSGLQGASDMTEHIRSYQLMFEIYCQKLQKGAIREWHIISLGQSELEGNRGDFNDRNMFFWCGKAANGRLHKRCMMVKIILLINLVGDV